MTGTFPSFHIPLPADLDFGECRWYMDRGYDDCTCVIRDLSVYKAVRYSGKEVLFRMTAGEGGLVIELLCGVPDEALQVFLTAFITEWLDIGRDLRPFYDLLARDKRFAYMATDYKGLRLVGMPDLFEALAWSITGQQINLKFAYTLKRRLVERYGDRLSFGEDAYHLFPSYDRLAAATVEDLRALQFSRSKAGYLIGLAASFSRGELSRERLIALPDGESRIKELTRIKGIGAWTANYALMKSLREPACIPHGDTGLLTALSNHGVIKDRSEQEKIDRFFRRFTGWESYLSFYLWRSLSVRPGGGEPGSAAA